MATSQSLHSSGSVSCQLSFGFDQYSCHNNLTSSPDKQLKAKQTKTFRPSVFSRNHNSKQLWLILPASIEESY